VLAATRRDSPRPRVRAIVARRVSHPGDPMAAEPTRTSRPDDDMKVLKALVTASVRYGRDASKG